MKKKLLLLFLTSASTCCGEVFDECLQLYEEYGDRRYMIQEEITQKEHALQAAYFARSAGASEEVVVGLLLHDIGQLVESERVGDADYLHARHSELGYAWLSRKGFPPEVCDLARFHDLAKIVLCDLEPDYYENLSEASKISYLHQFEKYSQPEFAERIEAFYRHPRMADFLCARKCDDMAKIADCHLCEFESFRESVERALKGECPTLDDASWRENIDALFKEMIRDREAFERNARLHFPPLSLQE